MKSHLLKCSQKNKNHEMEKQLTTALQEREWKCMWSSCSSSHINNAEKAATHMSHHITADAMYCQWGSCTFKASTLADLHAHVAVSHQVYSHKMLAIMRSILRNTSTTMSIITAGKACNVLIIRAQQETSVKRNCGITSLLFMALYSDRLKKTKTELKREHRSTCRRDSMT
jgi:hypothetical protein